MVQATTQRLWATCALTQLAFVRLTSNPQVVGHRQVTDAYLLGLAAHQRQRLATLDRGLLVFAQAIGLAGHVELVSGKKGLLA